jgi:hypothetical protein
MLIVEKVDTENKAQVKEFVELPYRLYKDIPQYVPPLLVDQKLFLQRDKHPFYEHSQADFFLAKRDGRVVGRISALENRNYNKYHGTKKAQFYLFDCEDDQEAANGLFEQVFEWARVRQLDTLIGPKGFGVLDGYGLLQEGYENRQVMSMMNYNFPYYIKLVESLGFEKEVDFVSCYLHRDNLNLPPRINTIAERVLKRGTLGVTRFRNKSDLKAWAPRIGKAYNQTFVSNWEYAPLTDAEIKVVLDNVLLIADPKMIKIITHNEDVVGFLLGFPDLSVAMQRAKGHLFPFGMVDLMLEIKRTNWLAVNGAGVLPEFQGHGGNALMYSEMEKTILENPRYVHFDMTQVAETAVQMRRDLASLGGKPYKNHRVFHRAI